MREEQQRLSSATSQSAALNAERRMIDLESQLADMSVSIGECERQRQSNFATIEKLKSRIHQLDSDNTTLLDRLKKPSVSEETDSDELTEQLRKLANRLRHLDANTDLYR